MALNEASLIASLFYNPDKYANHVVGGKMFDETGGQTDVPYQTPNALMRVLVPDAMDKVHQNENWRLMAPLAEKQRQLAQDNWLADNADNINFFAQQRGVDPSTLTRENRLAMRSMVGGGMFGTGEIANQVRQSTADWKSGLPEARSRTSLLGTQEAGMTSAANLAAGVPQSNANRTVAGNQFFTDTQIPLGQAEAANSMLNLEQVSPLERDYRIAALQKQIDTLPLEDTAQRAALTQQIHELENTRELWSTTDQTRRNQSVQGLIASQDLGSYGRQPRTGLQFDQRGNPIAVNELGTMPTQENFMYNMNRGLYGGSQGTVRDTKSGQTIGSPPEIQRINAPAVPLSNPAALQQSAPQQNPLDTYVPVKGFEGYEFNPATRSAVLREGSGFTPITDQAFIDKLETAFNKSNRKLIGDQGPSRPKEVSTPKLPTDFNSMKEGGLIGALNGYKGADAVVDAAKSVQVKAALADLKDKLSNPPSVNTSGLIGDVGRGASRAGHDVSAQLIAALKTVFGPNTNTNTPPMQGALFGNNF